MTRKIIQCAQCVTWWYHCTELNKCGIMKPQVGFPECLIFDMAMSYFTALHDSFNLHDPWGIKIWWALGGKEDHTMPFANCMGCDFQSYNQIYNWTNMSWNCIVYFLGFPSVVVNRPRNSSVRIRCTRMSVQLWMYMLCVYCMSEWFVEICQAFNDPDTHLGCCVLFTSNAISLWWLMNQISTKLTKLYVGTFGSISVFTLSRQPTQSNF